MAALLKSFGKGCLYLLVLPFGIILLAAYAVIGIGMFVYIGIKSLILFFTGRNIEELDEDTKARFILEKQKEGQNINYEEEVNVQEELKNKISNDFASNYYVPLDSSIPTPKEVNEEKKEEIPTLEHPDLGGNDHD